MNAHFWATVLKLPMDAQWCIKYSVTGEHMDYNLGSFGKHYDLCNSSYLPSENHYFFWFLGSFMEKRACKNNMANDFGKTPSIAKCRSSPAIKLLSRCGDICICWQGPCTTYKKWISRMKLWRTSPESYELFSETVFLESRNSCNILNSRRRCRH